MVFIKCKQAPRLNKVLLSTFVLSYLFFALQGCNQEKEPANVDNLLQLLDGDSIRAHIKYLADDKLQGRQAGTEGYELAVKYVISTYKSIGLEPGGQNDSYLQEVPLRTGKIIEDESSLSVKIGEVNTALTMGEDYFYLPDLNAKQSSLSAEVVFVGYGVDGTKWNLNHNDYMDRDVEGKVVLMDINAPETFSTTGHAYFSDYGNRFEQAVEHGAVGIIYICPNPRFGVIVDYYRSRGNTGTVGTQGEVFGGRSFGSSLKFAAFINLETIKKIYGKEKQTIWDDISNEENLTVEVKTASIYRDFKSNNVLGKISGSDPSLRQEYVIHTAHLDHLGVGNPINGDSIYNGAHDNASGVATSLEIARLYSKLEVKPKRSILFLMTTAEEMGLLGSNYFTRFPTVDPDNIVANINTDMPTLIAPLLSIEPIGAEHSSLMDHVESAADLLGLDITPDHMPETVRFIRSDQYNFIRMGVPALHVKYGLKSVEGSEGLSSKIDEFSTNVYHKPADELNDSFDFSAAEIYARLNFLISYSIAQDSKRPVWNEDSFFRKRN